MARHSHPHPLRGQVVLIGDSPVEFEVEDWADRVRPNATRDTVYGRVLAIGNEEQQIPLSRTFPNAVLS